MKVVLFCGGLGTRLKEFSETIPKPMVEIGYRPLIWHLMRYYAHFGHKEFILCLGFRGDYIKKYFLQYDECLSNNFVMTEGGKNIQLFDKDIDDWKISFIDTGQDTNIGQRLLLIKDLLKDEEAFMANYSDGLTDLDLDKYLDYFRAQGKIASFLSVKPSQSFHLVSIRNDGSVDRIQPVTKSNLWINGGFFIFKNEIFNYIHWDEELVQEPFYRLIEERQLITYKNSGFWACVDTMKEKRMFDDMVVSGNTPWMIWEKRSKNGRNANTQMKQERSEQFFPDPVSKNN